MPSSISLLRSVRLIHLYCGVFIAPAVLFFAFSGAMQTLSLHETTRGSEYKPPAWAVTLAQLHKKQTTVVPARKPAPSQRPEAERPQTAPAVPQQFPSNGPPAPLHNAVPLKIFFLIVSIGLFFSTLSGLYMSYKYIRRKVLITCVLISGVTTPIALTILF